MKCGCLLLQMHFCINFTGLHWKVISGIGGVELMVWGLWAALTSHPSRWKLRTFFVASILTLCFRMLDFPPYKGYVDAHALWRTAAIPLSYLWWSFVREDAVFRTTVHLKKAKWWQKWFKSLFFFYLLFFRWVSPVFRSCFFRCVFAEEANVFALLW